MRFPLPATIFHQGAFGIFGGQRSDFLTIHTLPATGCIWPVVVLPLDQIAGAILRKTRPGTVAQERE